MWTGWGFFFHCSVLSLLIVFDTVQYLLNEWTNE
jgi:hypothetical protein